jgi:signal transduction histidine kinase
MKPKPINIEQSPTSMNGKAKKSVSEYNAILKTLDYMPLPSVLVDVNGIVLSFNRKAKDAFDLGRDIKTTLDLDRALALENGQGFSEIVKVLEKKESKTPVLVHYKAPINGRKTYVVHHEIIDANVRIFQFTETIVDIENSVEKAEIKKSFDLLHEELRQTQEELTLTRLLVENSELSYLHLFENIPSGVAIYQPVDKGNDFRFVDFNQTAERITNTKRYEVIGHTLREKFPNMHESPLFRALQEVYRTGQHKHIYPFYYKDRFRDGWRENDIYKLPSGEIVAIFNDVTEKMEYVNQIRTQNKELKAAIKKAEETERLKTAFLQNLSHEVRTPLNAICGFSNLLRMSTLTPEKQNEYIDIINESSSRLLTVITDVLTISSLELGLEKVYNSVFNLNDLLSEVFENFREDADKKLLLMYTSPGFEHEKANIKSDFSKMRRILTNLVGNAVKFTHKGSVVFGYKIMGKTVEFFIKDSGIGIKTDDHEAIFERFRQAGDLKHSEYGGNGLGLSIAKAYVELLGGKIWLISEPGKGTTFFFTVSYVPENFAIADEFKHSIKNQIPYSWKEKGQGIG